MNETLTAKIKETGDLIHELKDFTDYDNLDEHDDFGLKNDEVVAVAIELLNLVLETTIDENSGATASDVERIKANKVEFKKYLTGFIGDADKTAAFIDLTLKKIRDNAE